MRAAAGSGGLLVVLLSSGASAGIRDTMIQGVDVLGLPPVWRHAGVAAAYTACVWAVLEGLLLPLRFFRGFVLERRYALSGIGAVRWVSTHLKTVALSGVVVVCAAVVVSLSLAFWPAWWWVVSGAVFAVGTILLTNLAPVCIIPLLYSVRPVARVRLRKRLAGLAERAGVPAPRVDECAVGGDDEACARLAGRIGTHASYPAQRHVAGRLLG